jgi:CheY-like chemotaxis protein
VEALQAGGNRTPVVATCADRAWRPAVSGIFGVLPVPFEEEALIAAAEAALSGDRERLQEVALTPQTPAQPLIPGSPNLRRRQALRARTATALPVKAVSSAPPAAPARRRILLIDADPATLERHRKALVASGYEVTAIRQGEEGFERGMTEGFDMIVTDLWLPGLDGFEMIAGLKGGGSEAAIVVTTAYLRKDMVAELRGLGVRRVLIKPFPEAALTRCALSTVRP